MREMITEFVNLEALMVGLYINVTLLKPGAMSLAHCMAKAIYSMKIESLFRGNERVIKILQLMNCRASSVSTILSFTYYHQSWLTRRIGEDARVNDVQLIQRLQILNMFVQYSKALTTFFPNN